MHAIVFDDHERRIWFVPQIIVREKVREQLTIFEYRVDRASQKTGVATESAHRVSIGRAIPPDLKVIDLEHLGFHAADYIVGKRSHAISFSLAMCDNVRRLASLGSGANGLIGLKHPIKHFAPGITLDHSPAGFVSGGLQIGLAHRLDRRGQRFWRILFRPVRLVGEDDSIHIASVDSDHGRAARLALEGDEAERFLNARVDKQIGCTINPGELLLVRAVPHPGR